MSEAKTEEKIESCPPALQEIIHEFREALPRERLELLIEYSDDLPDLPARLQGKREAMEQIHECQASVFLHTELNNGHVDFYLDIPRESPTVRGYASILVEGLKGATPEEIQATPEDVYLLLGLHEAITPQRLRGLHAVIVYIKRQVQRLYQAAA